jgi:hypothetical protein
MISIGIDPGKQGGIACINGGTAWTIPMPETHSDLLTELKSIAVLGGCFATLEFVSSSPQMGVKSAFTFGEGYGALQMALVAAGIPFERVTPSKWQKAMGCLSKGNKNVTKAKAQELFTTIKVTHKNADALLIAEYGRRARK